MIKTKLKAFSFHFALSVTLVTLIVSAIIYFWFPLDYLSITSFKEIALLIISIDLVLGPLLTFVVFNPNKKSLRFDLAFIAIFQLSALVYGSYTLYQTHPVYLTFSENSFNLVSAKDVQPEKAKHEEYKISKLSSVKLAYAETPTDISGAIDVAIRKKTKGAQQTEQRAELYKPYNQHKERILDKKLDFNLIFSDKELSEKTNASLSKYKDIDKFAFLPLRGSSKNAIIVIDQESAHPVDTINTDPWKYAKK